MKGRLNNLTIKLCENLPFSVDLFRQDGECIKQAESCKYYEEKGDEHLCKKQAYVFQQGQSAVLA